MIEELKKKIASLKKELQEAEEELKKEVVSSAKKDLNEYIGKCCILRTPTSISYLIDIREIEEDESYYDGSIHLAADHVIRFISDDAFPEINLDADEDYYYPGVDTIEEIQKDEIWGKVAETIKDLLDE